MIRATINIISLTSRHAFITNVIYCLKISKCLLKLRRVTILYYESYMIMIQNWVKIIMNLIQKYLNNYNKQMLCNDMVPDPC